MKIGQGVQWTERAHLVVVLTLGLPWFPSATGNKISVPLSTREAEYIVLSLEVREAVWLHKILTYLFDHKIGPTIIHCDNHSCVKLSENLVFHDRLKHIEIKYHYIRDMV
jgi:hypothetical protein